MTDHPKCRTCDHFKPDSDEWDTPPGFGKCGLIQLASHVTGWNDNYEANEFLPQFKNHLAVVMDASSYRAELFPSPDFYCPMHSQLMPDAVSIEVTE